MSNESPVWAIRCHVCGNAVGQYAEYFTKRKNEIISKLGDNIPHADLLYDSTQNTVDLSELFEEIGFDRDCCRTEIYKSDNNPEVIINT